MAWFARFRRRLKNYTSDGDYAGSHGGGGGGGAVPRPARTHQSTAYREAAITEVRTRGSVGPGG